MCYKLNIVFVFLLTFFTILQNREVNGTGYFKDNIKISSWEYHNQVVGAFFRKRENWTTSALGSVLFKNKMYPRIQPARANRIFHILLWNNLYEREKFVFGENSTEHYLKKCSVDNCIFHGENDALNISDAVVVNVEDFGFYPRMPLKKFIFYDVEPPVTVNISTTNMIKISNKFNWSMTYRSDSDVPIPYGRVEPLTEPKEITTLGSINKLVPYWTTKTKRILVAATVSDCRAKYKVKFIKALKEYIGVYFFGRCGDDKYSLWCDGSSSTCSRRFYFYVAIENYSCRQYITEIVFNAYANGAIPIIKGPPAEDCAKLLPPHSYILADNFPSFSHLAHEIFTIGASKEKLLSYHVWRAHFKIVFENGFLGNNPIAFCRLCEAMNYNSLETSVYTHDDILLHLESRLLCDLQNTTFIPPPLPQTRYCFKFQSGECIEI